MRKFMKLAIAPFAALFLFGCASAGFVDGVEPEGAAQRVLAAEADYYAAFTAMATYEGLPRCSNPDAPEICSEQSVVDVLRTIDNRFVEARDVAWTIVRSVNPDASVLENAIVAMTAVTGEAIKIVSNLKSEGLI